MKVDPLLRYFSMAGYFSMAAIAVELAVISRGRDQLHTNDLVLVQWDAASSFYHPDGEKRSNLE